MEAPELSVVMSVFNGESHLRESVESVLAQEEVPLEFLVVNDGSSDASGDILRRYARLDSRLRVIDQANRGLTLSLIRGCSEARGALIARQDADDVSCATRFREQRDLLNGAPDVTLVGCWMRHIGPRGEDLGTWDPPADADEATRSLRCGDLERFRSLGGHGSAMFRRSDYVRAGGYRQEFYFAQDLDLWLRLTEFGKVQLVPKVLYAWRMTPGSVTGRFRAEQVRTAHLILELTRIRAKGGSEVALLAEAVKVRPGPEAEQWSRATLAAGWYFIGKRLLAKKDRRAVEYLRRAALTNPWAIRSWIALLAALWLRAVATRGPIVA